VRNCETNLLTVREEILEEILTELSSSWQIAIFAVVLKERAL